jgi:hypothetical protein
MQFVICRNVQWNQSIGIVKSIRYSHPLHVTRTVHDALNPREYEQKVTVESVNCQGRQQPAGKAIVTPGAFRGPTRKIANSKSSIVEGMNSIEN